MDYKESEEWYNWSTIYYFERQVESLESLKKDRESDGKYASARWDKVLERYQEALDALTYLDKLKSSQDEGTCPFCHSKFIGISHIQNRNKGREKILTRAHCRKCHASGPLVSIPKDATYAERMYADKRALESFYMNMEEGQ